ncbi:MAG: alpha-L-rhamnosidase [Clostridiales bacterium]|nr:alpha-L-rhamnosidase [Clostridiales bacterium]
MLGNNTPVNILQNAALASAPEDRRVRKYLLPKRIVLKEGDVTGTKFLTEDRPPQINLAYTTTCTIKGKGYIILDYGVEFHGAMRLLIASTDPRRIKIRIRFGESVGETCAEWQGEDDTATNDHINRDIISDVGFLSMNEYGPTGYRFVRIDNLEDNATLSIKSALGIAIYRDIEYKGSFECSDEALNKIWQVGAYTVHQCMQEYVWDGIKRDRLVWIGDMHPETSTIQAVFGYDESVPKSLDLAREETPIGKWMDGISSYSLWWMIIHYEWYMQNGDIEYLKEQEEYLTALLKVLIGCVDDEGCEHMPDARFIDWPSSDDMIGLHAGLQGLLCTALTTGATLLRELGNVTLAEECEAIAKKMHNHVPDTNNNKRAAALLAMSGIGDARAINSEILSKNGAFGLSTFYGYYVLIARAMAGDIKGSLDNIRDYWGGMLSVGATTFWEDFDLEWLQGAGRIDEPTPVGLKDIHGDYGNYCYKGFRHSLCHGWASGPTAFLSEYVLGVKPAVPGCKKVKIEPRLGDLKWARGTYPTPFGVICVEHVKDENGNINSKITLPEGVERV